MGDEEYYSNPSKRIKLEPICHPVNWTPENHYGSCGQSCPCCRARIEDNPFGVCTICWRNLGK